MDDSDWFSWYDPDFIENEYDDALYLEWFGLWQLSVSEAAELIAVTWWFEGRFRECKVPPKKSYTRDDPDLLKALSVPIKAFRERLAEVFILPPFWNASCAERIGHIRAVKRFQGV